MAVAVKGAGNALVSYNSNDISPYINGTDLQNTVSELEATVLTSTAEESTPGLGSYTLGLDGNWSKALDDILGPDSISVVQQTVVVTLKQGANTITYTWTNNGFITNYNVKTAANDKIAWSAQLRLNNAPVRAVS